MKKDRGERIRATRKTSVDLDVGEQDEGKRCGEKGSRTFLFVALGPKIKGVKLKAMGPFFHFLAMCILFAHCEVHSFCCIRFKQKDLY